MDVVRPQALHAVEVVAHGGLEGGVAAVVHPRSGEGDVAQGGGAETVGVGRIAGDQGAAEILSGGVLARSHLGDGEGVVLEVAEQRAVVAVAAAGLAEEVQGAALGRGAEGRGVAGEVAIEGRVQRGPGLAFEGGDGPGGVSEAQFLEGLRAGEGLQEHRSVFLHGAETLHEGGPQRGVVRGVGDLVRTGLAAHLLGGGHGEEGLRGEGAVEWRDHRGQRRRTPVESGLGGLVHAGRRIEDQAAVPEHRVHTGDAGVEHVRRVARDHVAVRQHAVLGQTAATLADRQRQGVARCRRGMVTGGAADVAVAREDLVEEQRLAEFEQSGVGRLGARDRADVGAVEREPQGGVEFVLGTGLDDGGGLFAAGGERRQRDQEREGADAGHGVPSTVRGRAVPGTRTSPPHRG